MNDDKAGSDALAGVILGGWFNRPHYAASYRLAARVLFEQAHATGQLQGVAVPFVFLVRHAVELAFKEIVEAIASVQADQAFLDERQGKPATVVQVPKEDLEKLAKTHKWKDILDLLRKHLPLYGYPPEVPPTWVALADKIDKLEDGSDQFYRFDRVKKGGKLVQGIPTGLHEHILVPIEELLVEAEAVLKEAIGEPTKGDEDDSLLSSLWLECMAIDQALDNLQARLADKTPAEP